jgi:predicted SAM-dependent methyltransferase
MDAKKIRLNLGCGAIRPEGWVNADSSFNALLQRLPIGGKRLAKLFNPIEYSSNNVVYMDVNKPWKYRNESVDIVYASHLFEHLTLKTADLFLRESFRVLKPGGVIRLVVPDLYQICRRYVNEFEDPEVTDPTVYILWAMNLHKEAQYPKEGFFNRLINEFRGYPHQHKFMYDAKSLALRLSNAGFKDINMGHYGFSKYISEINDVEGVSESYLSAYVEAIK